MARKCAICGSDDVWTKAVGWIEDEDLVGCRTCGASFTVEDDREQRVAALLAKRFPPGSDGPNTEDVVDAYQDVDMGLDLDDPCFDGDMPDEDIPFPDEFGRHVGFFLQTDAGPIHVLGDPDMSPETAAALGDLVMAAVQAVKNGTLKADDEE